jgi:hypothetical protein
LRYFAERGLPALDEFPGAGLRDIFGPAPESTWVHDILAQGRGLVLVDGFDELPHGRSRNAAREWLQSLVASYPHSRYIVTTRPAALPEDWLKAEDFALYELQPMSPSDIAIFSRQWHEAVKQEIADVDEIDLLSQDASALARVLAADRHLRDLCATPLLCALLCALNRERRHQLPRNRLAVYRAALDMLLERRDREREASRPGDLTADEAIYLLQDLAAYLVRNEWADVNLARATYQVKLSLQGINTQSANHEIVMRNLIERSGIIREVTVGRIDFVHKTFQEFLAAKQIVENDEIGLLIDRSKEDQWREVIILAAAQMTARQANELMSALLSADAKTPTPRTKLLLLACLQSVRALNPKLRTQIRSVAKDLIPPNDMDTARVLASVGDWVLELLKSSPKMTSPQALASIRTASLLGGNDALQFIAQIVNQYWTEGMASEIVQAWPLFDRDDYAALVFPAAPIRRIRVADPLVLPFLPRLGELEELELVDLDRLDLWRIDELSNTVRRLVVSGPGLSGLDGIEHFPELTHLEIELRRAGTDLSPILRLRKIEGIRIATQDGAMLALRGLSNLPCLRMLQISQPEGALLNLAQLNEYMKLTLVVRPGMVLIGNSDKADVVRVNELPPMV